LAREKKRKKERKERIRVLTKKPHPKVQNTQWGALKGENIKPKT
jgi:hypothetical protein